jgi:hypothetical protein
MLDLLATTALYTHQLVAAVDNPLDGLVPDFSFGGAKFTQLWQKAITAIWGIGILISIVYLVIGIVGMAGASGEVNPNPQAHAVGRKKALWAGVSLGVLAALALVVGAILTFAS